MDAVVSVSDWIHSAHHIRDRRATGCAGVGAGDRVDDAEQCAGRITAVAFGSRIFVAAGG